MVEGARQYIASFLEQCLLSGKGSTIGCIFAAKNWLGYRDTTTVEDFRPHGTYPSMSPEEIQRQLEKDIPLDDLETAEIKSF